MQKVILISCVLLLSGCASDSARGWWMNSYNKGWWINSDKGVWFDSKGWDAPSKTEAAQKEWFDNYYGRDKGCNIHGC